MECNKTVVQYSCIHMCFKVQRIQVLNFILNTICHLMHFNNIFQHFLLYILLYIILFYISSIYYICYASDILQVYNIDRKINNTQCMF